MMMAIRHLAGRTIDCSARSRLSGRTMSLSSNRAMRLNGTPGRATGHVERRRDSGRFITMVRPSTLVVPALRKTENRQLTTSRDVVFRGAGAARDPSGAR